jgi:hypothetical protein
MADDGEDALREAYRSPQRDEGSPPVPEHVLHYFPEPKAASWLSWWFRLMAPLFAYVTVAALSGSAVLGVLAAAAVLTGILSLRSRAKRVPRATFTVEGSLLQLSGPAFPAGCSFELSQLLDVYLDTETIQRVRENPGPIPDLRLIDATLGGEQDTARIALELELETYFLTEERLSHLDASEWHNKIRRFLRKHAWVPDDER